MSSDSVHCGRRNQLGAFVVFAARCEDSSCLAVEFAQGCVGEEWEEIEEFGVAKEG